jgi:putative DNA primase/helicase
MTELQTPQDQAVLGTTQHDHGFRRTGLWLASLGAVVCVTGDAAHGARNDKAVIHEWKKYYTQGGQSGQDLDRLPWDGYRSRDGQLVQARGIGVLSGLGGWRCADFDWFKDERGQPMEGQVDTAAVATFLYYLGTPEDYTWIVLSGSGKGYQVWFRCDEDLPVGALPAPQGKDKATYWADPKVPGQFHHVELRWSGCQTLVPPSTHPTGPGYHWATDDGQPTAAPALVPVAKVLEAFLAIATPQVPKAAQATTVATPKKFSRADNQTSGRTVVEKVLDQLDLVAFAEKNWAGQLQQDPDGQLRVLGQGGFLLSAGTTKDAIWYHHSGDIGGDALDLVGYSIWPSWSKADRADPVKFRAVLELAGREAGVHIPGPQDWVARPPEADRPGDAAWWEAPVDPDAVAELLGEKANPARSAIPSGASKFPGVTDRTDKQNTTTTPTVCQSPKLSPDQVLDYISRQEVGDAEALAALYGRTVAWDSAEKSWYIWDGRVWSKDDRDHVKVLIFSGLVGAYGTAVEDLGRDYALLTRPGSNPDPAALEAIQKQMGSIQARVAKLLTSKRIDATLTLLKPLVARPARMWDGQPYMFPVANGVIDLTTGQLLEPDPARFLRTTSSAEYAGLDVPAPRWTRFLEEVFQDKPEADRAAIIGYLQRLLGYGLTGDTQDHHFSVWWGEQGRNGKGTILNTVQKVLGQMMGKVSKEVLVHRTRGNAGGASEHMYSLKGKRLAYVDELSKDERLDLGQVKELTGGGTVLARPNYGHEVEWAATHHLILSTNYRPHAATEDEAFWQRASLVEFRMRFLKDPDLTDPHQKAQDPNLEADLAKELPGILAWLVRGCLAWQKEGHRVQVPECVKSFTSDYRQDEDTLGAFLADEYDMVPGAAVGAKDFYMAYRSWAEAMGYKKPMFAGDFGLLMKSRPGIVYKATNKGRYYFGVQARKAQATTVGPMPKTIPAAGAAAEAGKAMAAKLRAAQAGGGDQDHMDGLLADGNE